MSEDRFLIETTCLGDDVRSYIDPQTLEHSSGAPLEHEWLPVGTIKDATIEWDRDVSRPLDYFHAGSVDGAIESVVQERRLPPVVIVGATASQRELIARLTPEVLIAFFDELSDVDVKAFDSIDTRLHGAFVVTDEDQKKMVEMFDRLTEYPPLRVAVEPNWDGVGSFGVRRGKKGKFKKDWQR